MKRITISLGLALFAGLLSSCATSQMKTAYFKLCPVVSSSTPQAKPFAYNLIQVSTDQPEQDHGFYLPEPILDSSSLIGARGDSAEVAAKPFPAVRLEFNVLAQHFWNQSMYVTSTGQVAVLFGDTVVCAIDAQRFGALLERPDPHVQILFQDRPGSWDLTTKHEQALKRSIAQIKLQEVDLSVLSTATWDECLALPIEAPLAAIRLGVGDDYPRETLARKVSSFLAECSRQHPGTRQIPVFLTREASQRLCDTIPAPANQSDIPVDPDPPKMVWSVRETIDTLCDQYNLKLKFSPSGVLIGKEGESQNPDAEVQSEGGPSD
jgi:hypothetical protein